METNYEIDLKSVGKRIKAARLRLGFTQEKIAGIVFLTGQYWSLIETGRERGSVNTYLLIAKALGLTLDDIFYDEEELRHIRMAYTYDSLLKQCSDFEKTVVLELVMTLRRLLGDTEK